MLGRCRTLAYSDSREVNYGHLLVLDSLYLFDDFLLNVLRQISRQCPHERLGVVVLKLLNRFIKVVEELMAI